MHVVVIGRSGQVAQALLAQPLQRGEALEAFGRPDLDIADRDAVMRLIAAARPNVVINAAADTHVEAAEDNPGPGLDVNLRGAGHVAEAAWNAKALLFHLSTDYVFDGEKGAPYAETDPPRPLNAYGAAKHGGELQVLGSPGRSTVVRTSWIYAPRGRNFVRTMLNLARGRDEVAVVEDQTGNPTLAFDIAAGLLSVARKTVAGGQSRPSPRILHMAAPDCASWADLAETVFEESCALKGPWARVQRIPSSGFPQKARRPKDSRLDSSLLQQAFGVALPSWKTSVRRCVADILEIEKDWS